MMKGIIGFISILVFIGSVKAQTENGYEITGSIEGLKEGQKVRAIMLYYGSWKMDCRDSSYVKNREFHIKGTVTDGPREYILQFDSSFALHLVMDNREKIIIHSNQDLSHFHHNFIDDYVTIYGAPYNTSMRQLLASWFFYDRTRINLLKAAKKQTDSIGFDGAKLSGIFEAIDQLNKSFEMEVFTSTPNQTDSELTIAYPLLTWPLLESSKHAAFIANEYERLLPRLKNSYAGKVMGDYARLCVGQSFPEFSLTTPDGNQLALEDVVRKSKVTIVHFWAADSYKRKEMEDELRLLYKKYHDKGLSIIGVSSDKYVEQWKDMLAQEQFPWYNVSVLKPNGGIVETVYHEYGDSHTPNTTNVLIDSQGKIIAWDVEGVEMHWELWKELGD